MFSLLPLSLRGWGATGHGFSWEKHGVSRKTWLRKPQPSLRPHNCFLETRCEWNSAGARVQHSFPVFHPWANKVISFICCNASGRPHCLRLEASRCPSPHSKQTEEGGPGLPGEGFVLVRVVNSSLHMCFQGASGPFLSWQSAGLCSWPGALCGLPDPYTWSSRKTPGSLTSTSNPTCPAQTFSWLDYVLRDVPRVSHFCGAITTTWLLSQKSGCHCAPSLPNPCNPAARCLGLGSQASSQQGGADCLAWPRLLFGVGGFSRAGQAGSPLCPSSQHRVWQGDCSEKLERMSEWMNEQLSLESSPGKQPAIPPPRTILPGCGFQNPLPLSCFLWTFLWTCSRAPLYPPHVGPSGTRCSGRWPGTEPQLQLWRWHCPAQIVLA